MSLTFRALELGRALDLSDFVLYLRQTGINHRVVLENNHQVVWVESEQAAFATRVAFQRLINGELPPIDNRVGSNSIRLKQILALLAKSPLTMTIIIANVVCYPVTRDLLENGVPGEWLPLFMFTDFIVMGGQLRFADLSYTFEAGQYWRLLSPMLVHFGILHLVFNLLWMWEFGRRIEQRFGQLVLLLVVVLSSVAANLLQYFMYGAGLFGGMSGVVFGLIGFAMIWDKRRPDQTHGVAPGIYIFMLIYLALGFTGAIDLLGLGNVANGAHLGGLLARALAGELAHRFIRTNQQPVR